MRLPTRVCRFAKLRSLQPALALIAGLEQERYFAA